MNVVLHYGVSAVEAGETAEAARAFGVNAWTLPGDLSGRASVPNLFDRAVAVAGPVDYLINNAACFPADRLETMTPEALHNALDLNAVTPFVLARRFAEQRRAGAIVNLLDARIVDYDREHAAYHLAKRMLFTLTRMMAMEFAPLVRVNAVAPGLILPPVGQDASYLERLVETNPLHRHGGVEDVAEAVLYLLRGDFVTGQVLFVDGGRHMKGNMYGC